MSNARRVRRRLRRTAVVAAVGASVASAASAPIASAAQSDPPGRFPRAVTSAGPLRHWQEDPGGETQADGITLVHWRLLQHNIQGGAADHHGNTGYISYLTSAIVAWLPIAASGNEVCQQQRDAIYDDLHTVYNIWFSKAHPGADNCVGQPFGNLLLTSKGVSSGRDTTYTGYQSGSPSTAYTLVFDHQYNGSERKRADCAVITGGTSVNHKFSVCTTHTSANQPGQYPQYQANEIAASGSMGPARLFMGDFNLTKTWAQQQAGSYLVWKWDDQTPTTSTHSSGKIDWVFGRTDDHVSRLDDSDVHNYGQSGYNSDHRLLEAYMKPFDG